MLRLTPVAALLTLATLTSAYAQDDVAAFYKGRQMTMLVGSGAGGTYDVSARILARHIVRHIPGNPTIVVQNQPGAGGLTVANQMFNAAPRDGSMIALVNNGVPTSPFLTPDQAKFDPVKLSWLGATNRETQIVVVWHTAPVTTMDDLFKKEVIVGGVAPGTATVDYPLVANSILGTKFKIVSGYAGTPAVNLAMERGEIQGDAGRGWVTAKAQDIQLIRDKKFRIIAQYGARKAADLPDTPLMPAGKTEADQQALTLLYSRQEYGRPFFAPPGVPPARLAALRAAFDATLKDPEFLADAKKALWETELVTGPELDALTKRLATTPPAVAARLRQALASAGVTKK
jgi:tripartite-type tricarboxylate transporter receptor subunit TctC